MHIVLIMDYLIIYNDGIFGDGFTHYYIDNEGSLLCCPGNKVICDIGPPLEPNPVT